MIAFFVVDKFTLVLIMHQIKNSKYNKTYIIPNLQNVKKYNFLWYKHRKL